MVKAFISTFLILILILFPPFISFSEEIYEYERMWPALEQPWYFAGPEGVAVDSSGSVYVADTNNYQIQKFTSSGQFITKWGSEGNGDGQFNRPSGIALDNSGNVYVADTWNQRIQKFTSNGQFTAKWGSEGNGDGQFEYPESIAVDSSGDVYVTETGNSRIQKFTSNGEFITKWGSYGSGDGQFKWPEDIATDSSGNVYVADTNNYRIQKFTSTGQFITKWGSFGRGDGQFYSLSGIAVDSSGNVYVADGGYVVGEGNNCIQKFTSDGQFITKWGSTGSGDGQFYNPFGITVDSKGNIYVADKGNSRIQKFTSDGQFITKWGSTGSGDGQFSSPYGIAVDSSGNVYVADSGNSRIQKFTSSGQFITKWRSEGNGDGQFEYPESIAVDSSGNVYVADLSFIVGSVIGNNCIKKFTAEGQFITKWGSYGSGDGQFVGPDGIAIDSSGNVYVTDSGNKRVQKFTSDGQFITKWGSYGAGDGQFYWPNGVAVDSRGNVYVTDTYRDRIQKFSSDWQFITKWESSGSEDGQFIFPYGIAIDSSDNVYVTDLYNYRIQKFTSTGQFITKWGSLGSNPGEFSYPRGIAVSSDGKVYVSDTGNNRIQVFKPASFVPSNKVIKAIVVAGSGPYKGNNLWDATVMNANFAYRVLTYQGYTNDTIYYLSSDRNLDLNGDGKPDVDADATNSNLQSAITQWAMDAESLVVYLIGHGGDGTFRMSETEILRAEDLALWLNELQEMMQGLVTIVYDACESGSFVSKLVPPSGRQRINITSTSPGEPAYFLSQGALSFSYTFWSQIFGGAKIYDAYVVGKDVVGVAIGAGKSQNPEIDDNGNGIGNEKTDGDLARDKNIGKGFIIAGDVPSISTISQDQVLNGQTSATITVEVVTTGRITKAWAIVHSPDFTNPTDNPITDLPTFDLTWDEQSRRYEGTYNGFTVMGTYTVTVYAMNEAMIVSVPKTTKVEQLLSTLYTLTVSKSGTGTGTVSSSPSGIDCGSDCSESYNQGTSVTLTATPASGSIFGGWSGGGCSGTGSCSITMNSNQTITATFNQQPQHTLTVTKSGTGSGTVTSSPAGINCGDDCSESYSKVQKVKLTAKADASSTFAGWSGGGCSGTKTCTVTVDTVVTVTAVFALKIPDISVAQTPIDFGNIKVGKKGTRTLKIGNNGTGDLVITLSGLEGKGFSIQGSSSVIIKSKKSYSLKVLFTPKSAGLEAATLEIDSNDPDTPTLEISLSGIGQ